jgi:two-component sensor histidine kinase
MVAGLAFWTWSDFSCARSDAETIVATTALTMDEFTHESLQAVDGVLESLVAKIDERGIGNLDNETERENLRRIARRLPVTGTIYVANSRGSIVAAVPSLGSPINVSNREWFKRLKDEKVAPQVGRAFSRGPEGQPGHALFFRRSILGSDGTFIGAVQVGVGVPHFARIFRSLDVGFRNLDVRPDAKLGDCRTKDGAIVARFPTTEPIRDDTVATAPYFSLLANSEDGSWAGWTRIEGEEHLVSARRVHGWPLIVSVSLPEREVYSFAWARLLWRSAVAFVTIATLSILTILSTRQARREAALTGELEHRVKNTLAVVATVIERAREDTKSIDEFLSSVRARIQSMAGTQALLSQSRGQGVSVADLIRAELRPFDTGANTSVDGPPVHLLPAASHALAMVVHELATNAAKYGALSRPGGRVSMRWRHCCSARLLRIEWQETGGPQVATPARDGYGSSVIRDLLTYEYGAKVDLIFAASGIRCTIEMPATDDILS